MCSQEKKKKNLCDRDRLPSEAFASVDVISAFDIFEEQKKQDEFSLATNNNTENFFSIFKPISTVLDKSAVEQKPNTILNFKTQFKPKNLTSVDIFPSNSVTSQEKKKTCCCCCKPHQSTKCWLYSFCSSFFLRCKC